MHSHARGKMDLPYFLHSVNYVHWQQWTQAVCTKKGTNEHIKNVQKWCASAYIVQMGAKW